MKLSASSANRFINCPGSVKLIEDTLEEMKFKSFGEAAELGTKIHDMGEEVIKAIYKGTKPPTTAQLIKKHGIIDPAQKLKAVTAVKGYAKWFKSELKKHKNPKVIIEKKFRLHREGFEYVFKCDVMIYSKDRLCIGDLKSGNYDYSSSAFDQLNFSVMLYLETNPKYKPFDIVGTIIQPNFWQDDKKIVETNIDTNDFYYTDLETHLKTDKLCTGDHCKFCDAILVCPVIQNLTKVVESLAAYKDLDSVNIDTLQELYINKGNIEQMLKNISGLLLKKMTEEGKTLEKVMLKPSYGWRKWTDVKETEKKLKKKYGDKIYKDRELKTPKQLEVEFGKKEIDGLHFTPQTQKAVKRESEFDK